MHLNYYLDNVSKTSSIGKETALYAHVTRKPHVVKVKTGVRIEPRYWDKDKQCCKRSYPDVVGVNHFLADLKRRTLARLLELAGKELTREQLQSEVKKLIFGDTTPKNERGFFDYFQEYIDVKKVVLSHNSSKKHITALNHLKDFAAATQWTPSFESIDQVFYENFLRYLLQVKKHLDNTVLKQVVILKGFMNWSFDRGYTRNESHRHFKIREKETEVVHLSESEVMLLYHLNLADKHKLARVRDQFLFQIFTGQRYSDVAALDWDAIDFEGRWWTLTSQKTRDKLRIPLNDYALQILERYKEFRRLPCVSNQRLNQYLKELGQLAGIDSPFSITQFSGSRRIETKGPKYEFITSHVARKTFVTISLAKGMRPETVMSITGHKDYKTMKKYLKITNDMKASEMNNIWSFKSDK